MTKLRLAPDLTLPLEAITETIAILGIRGSGKTNTAVVYAEELLAAGQQIVVIDPTDAWWGLKSSKDGQKPGFAVVVLGGKQQNLPLASTDGKLVADFVVEQGASVVCSLRGFESKQQELAFTTAFLRRLYFLKGQQERPTPLALFIDEASRLVPQRVMGEDAACVGAVQQIVRQGRSSGFGVVLIDQRAATVNKDVLAQLEMLIVHRTTGPQDRKALREWVQQHDTESREGAFLDSLASLNQGQAWFWSPGWLNLFRKVDVRERKTFDSSRTPRAGEVAVVPKKIADVDIEALRDKMAATIEKAKADDPKELRKEIARLAKLVADKVPAKSDPFEIRRLTEHAVQHALADERKRTDGALDLLSRTVARLAEGVKKEVVKTQESIDRLGLAAQDLGEVANTNTRKARGEVQLDGEKGTGESTILGSAVGQNSRAPARPVAAPQPRAVRAASAEGALGKTPQRMLNALRFLETVGTSPASRAAVAGLVGVSADTGTFRNYLSDLRAPGYISDGPGTNLSLTDAGRQQASDEGLPTTTAELHDVWLSKLGGTPRRMLGVLLDAYPNHVTREQLGRACGIEHTTGTFRNYLSDMRSPGLIIDVDKATLRAADALFPEGMA